MLSKNIVHIDQQSCVACGACTKVCPRKAVTVHRGCFAVVCAKLCVGCGKCAKVCPAGCITVTERKVQP